MSPCAVSRSACGRPSRLSSVNSANRLSAPNTTPITLPLPPISCAPPITQAAMACSSSPWPTSVETPPKPPSRMPAVTALRAEMTKQAMRVRSTRMPASSAARGLSPTAKTRRPNTVPCSPHQASAATTSRTITDSGSWPITGTSRNTKRPKARKLSGR